MIIFTDGSSKKTDQVVVSGVVCLNNAHIVSEVVYCYKQTLNYDYKSSVHELLSILKAIEFVVTEKINEEVLIINDSVQSIKLFNELKRGDKSHLHFVKNDDVRKQLNQSNLTNFIFIQLPRTTLGINVADFLNKETATFTNSSDSYYLGCQMKKLNGKSFDFNISSKKKKNK